MGLIPGDDFIHSRPHGGGDLHSILEILYIEAQRMFRHSSTGCDDLEYLKNRLDKIARRDLGERPYSSPVPMALQEVIGI